MAIKPDPIISHTNGLWSSPSTWAYSIANGDQLTGSTVVAVTNVVKQGLSSSLSGISFSAGIDGVLLKISGTSATPTGTLSVILQRTQGGTTATQASVTISASDISPGNVSANGWWFFNFGTQNINISAGFLIALSSSISNQFFFYSNAGTNWNRSYRMVASATGQPSTGDTVFVVGELSGIGTHTSWTVTADPANTTSALNASCSSVIIGGHGTLTFTPTASTIYNVSGDLTVWSNGTLNIGTSGQPITSSATAQLLFKNAAQNGLWGLNIQSGGTFNAYGATSAFVYTRLNATSTATMKSLTSVDNTGWVAGNVLALASTNTINNSELVFCSGSTGTTISIEALVNSHTGTNIASEDMRCHVGNISHNVIISNNTTSAGSTYVFLTGSASANIQYVQFSSLGSGTNFKHGLDVFITGGVFNMQYCSYTANNVANCLGLNIASLATITASNNVFYGVGQLSQTVGSININPTLAIHVVTGNLLIGNNQSAGIIVTASSCNFDGNIISGFINGPGLTFNMNTPTQLNTPLSANNIISYGNSQGFQFNNTLSNTPTQAVPTFSINNCSVWRNLNNNINFNGNQFGLQFNGLSSWGGIINSGTNALMNTTFSACLMQAGQVIPATNAMKFGNVTNIYIVNCIFGSGTGSGEFFSSGDINVGFQPSLPASIFVYNSQLLSPSSIQSFDNKQQYVELQNCIIDTSGTTSNGVYYLYGSITANSTSALAPNTLCTALTPNIAANNFGAKLQQTYIFPVNSGTGYTISIQMMESSNQNGNNPILTTYFLGVPINTLLINSTTAYQIFTATISASQITTNGILECVLGCDGTAGAIFIQSVQVTPNTF